jgi:hypothetical protein
MPDKELRELLDWNHRIVLGDLLAMEAHLAVLGREEVKDSWCIVKHKVHALEHGVREAISHAEALGMDSSKYRRFYERLAGLPEVPTIAQVRELRDEWRIIAGDRTLASECPICSLDISEEAKKKLLELTRRIEEKVQEKPTGGTGQNQGSKSGSDSRVIIMAALTVASFLAMEIMILRGAGRG